MDVNGHMCFACIAQYTKSGEESAIKHAAVAFL